MYIVWTPETHSGRYLYQYRCKDFTPLLYWRPRIPPYSLSFPPFKIEFNSFWSLTNPIAIIHRFGLQQTLKPKRDWDELIWYKKIWASSSSSRKRGKSLINKFHFSRCWTQFREWFVFFNKRKVLDLFSKQNGLFFCVGSASVGLPRIPMKTSLV